LQATPFAIPIAVSIIGCIFVIWWGNESVREIKEVYPAKLQAMTPAEFERERGRLARRQWWTGKLNPFVQVLLVGVAVLSISTGGYASGLLVLVSQICAALWYKDEGPPSKKIRAAALLLILVSGWALPFLFGIERAHAIFNVYRKHPTNSEFG
jgi:cytochrome bd-type quinol oxidase subunit 1